VTYDQLMRRNIKLLYVFRALRTSLIAIPVIVPFWRANGLTQAQIFALQSVFAAGVVLLEAPSGYFADRRGRRCSLLVGAALSTLGFVVYSASYSFWPMAIAEVVLGFGASFVSGADSALAYDSLVARKSADQYRRYESRSLMYMHLTEASASILGGLIAILSLRATIVAQVAIYGCLVPLAWLLTEPVRQAAPVGRSAVREVGRIAKYALHGHREIKWLILYAAVVGTLTHTMVWLTQPYYEEAGIPIGWFGAIWAGQLVVGAVFARLADPYERTLGRRGSLVSFVAIGAACYGALASVQAVWMLPAVLGFYFIRGVFTPIIRDYLNTIVESSIRATVLSVQSLAQKLLYIGIGPLIGWVMDAWSLKAALGFSALFYGMLGLFVLAMMRRSKIL
jgi:MFS family permease